METIMFALTSIAIGLLFSIPGVTLGYWLKKKNLGTNRSLLTIIFCVTLTFAKRIWVPDLPFHWFVLVLFLSSTLGIYRMDMYWATTSKKINMQNLQNFYPRRKRTVYYEILPLRYRFCSGAEPA